MRRGAPIRRSESEAGLTVLRVETRRTPSRGSRVRVPFLAPKRISDPIGTLGFTFCLTHLSWGLLSPGGESCPDSVSTSALSCPFG